MGHFSPRSLQRQKNGQGTITKELEHSLLILIHFFSLLRNFEPNYHRLYLLMKIRGLSSTFLDSLNSYAPGRGNKMIGALALSWILCTCFLQFLFLPK